MKPERSIHTHADSSHTLTYTPDCTELTELPSNLICIPLRGVMQASFRVGETDAPAVESMLTDTITSILNGDDIRTQGIVQTAFIGSRVIEAPETSDEWKALPAIVGTSLSALVVFGMMGVFLMRRRRRKHEQQNQSSEIIPDLPMKKVVEPEQTDQTEAQRDVENPIDQEVPSVDPLLLSIATTRTASETIVDTDDSLNLQDGSLNSAPQRAIAIPPGTNATTDPPSVINLQPRPKAADGTALIRPPPNKPPLPVGKPPASPRSPPVAAAAAAALSKPLKQRRRKKRKKKPKMVRVNSRERVKEMETITETAEEETSDSEYSWYSETDSNASSRDVSPSRTESPSTTSSEDQLMVHLRQSLDSPSQLLSCGSSSKDEDDDDLDHGDDDVETSKQVAEVESNASGSSSSKAVSSASSGTDDSSKSDGEVPSNSTSPDPLPSP